MTRIRKILGVVFRNGLGIFFGKLRHLVRRRERNDGSSAELTIQERVRKVLEELGPVYVKVGQMLSTRPDLIGQEFATELTKLQDEAKPFPFEEVAAVIQKEFGAPVNELFAEFDEAPAAAASLAQGHRAVLKDGTKVFVKVQRPNAARQIRADMNVLTFLADQFHEGNPELRFLMLPKVVRQFRNSLLEEANFNNEKANIRRFAMQFRDDDRLVVPKVYDELSGEHVLTMEYIEGEKISNVETLRKKGVDTVKLSETVADLTLKQFFTHGFFHADPHPGNIFVLQNGKLCYLDFGLCGRLTADERILFCRFIVSVIERNEQHATQILLRLCDYEEEPGITEMECIIGEFIDRYFYGPLDQVDVPEALQQLYAACNHLHIALKPHIYLMLKTLGMADGFMRLLNPDYDIEKQLKPELLKITMRQFSPAKSLHQRVEDFFEAIELFSRAPAHIRNFTGKLMDGRLTFRQEFPQFDEYMRDYNHRQKQRTTAILTVGILINSTLLLQYRIPPIWRDFSILGAAGLATGILLAGALLVDLLRK